MSSDLAARLNLARTPFVNQRWMWRLVGSLWFLAIVLMLTNAVLFWRNSAGFADGRQELRRLSDERGSEIDELEGLSRSLQEFDLQAQNELVSFLNEKIVERTFPWSRLFDDLVETMPLDVQLTSLAPLSEKLSKASGARRQPNQEEEDKDWIDLDISGQAKDGEAVLIFLERLFESPAFSEPNLLNEALDDSRLVRFNLRARYRIGGVSEPEGESPEDVEGSPGSDSATEQTATAAGGPNRSLSVATERAGAVLDAGPTARASTAAAVGRSR